VEARAGIEPA